MAIFSRFAAVAVAVTFSAGLMIVDGTSEVRAQAANPCAPKVGAASSAKPEVDPKLVLRPKGSKPAQGNQAELIKLGKTLYESTKLSTNGLACQSCHANNENFAPTFSKAYPHEVAMAKDKGGVAKVQLDEMVQFCMVVPMQAKPLRWDSRELAALTAYTGEVQKAFRAQPRKTGATRANPCAPKANPCAPKK
jgi:cytochrome c